MDIHTPQFTDENTSPHGRGWYMLAAICLVLAILTRQPIVLVFGGFTSMIGLIPSIWRHFALKRLTIHQHISQTRVSFGETITYDLTVENRKLLPLPWLNVAVETPIDISLPAGSTEPSFKVNRQNLPNTYSLWPLQRVTRRYRIRCITRGVKSFGPISIESGDPLGWQIRESTLQQSISAIVYPPLFPLEDLGLLSAHPLGDFTTTWRLLEDPSRIIGVRDYVPGDDPRFIHWKVTARTGILTTRIFDPSSQQKMLLVLDITTYPEIRLGIDPEIMELLIATAASLVNWAVEQQYDVGLLSNGIAFPSETNSVDTTQTPHSLAIDIPIQNGVEHGEIMQNALARIISYFGSSIATLLLSKLHSLPIGTTVVLIIAKNVFTDDLLDLLDLLRRQGHQIAVILVGDDTVQFPELPAWIMTHTIGGREKWHELLAKYLN